MRGGRQSARAEKFDQSYVTIVCIAAFTPIATSRIWISLMPLPAPESVKAVIFDHDGTLVDSETHHYRHWCQVLAGHGVDFTEAEYIAAHAGLPSRVNAVNIARAHGLKVDPRHLSDAKEAVTRAAQRDSGFPLMPGVREALDRCTDAGLALAVASGAPLHLVHASLTRHGLSHFFRAVVSGDQVPRNKPAPDVYQRALAELNCAPGESLAVEDTENGLRAALAAGMTCVVVKNRYSAHHDFSGAAAVFESMEPLLAWMARRNPG